MTEPAVDDARSRALDAVARAMTAHPAPDLAARVRGRLAAPIAASRFGVRPAWAAVALAAAAVVALRLERAPEAPAPAPVATASAALAGPPAGTVAPVPPVRPGRPGTVLRPGLRVRPRPAARPPAAASEPWPGETLHARPLRMEPLAAPALDLPPIGVHALGATEPLVVVEAEGAEAPLEGEELR